MTSRYRQILSATLILLVALTSVHLGMARGQARMAGTIVLCLGTGPVAVAVDKDGQPLARPHICPDCVFSVMAGLAAPFFLAERQVHPRKQRLTAVRAVGSSVQMQSPKARSPPQIL